MGPRPTRAVARVPFHVAHGRWVGAPCVADIGFRLVSPLPESSK